MDTEQMASILEAVKVLMLRPEDILMLKCQPFLTEEQRALAMESLKKQFEHQKCVILDGGIDIEIVRHEAAS